MKVAFYVYPTAFQNPGGGEIQLLKTQQYLRSLGLEVKLFDPWQDKLESFDVLHTFGSVKEALPMMEAAKRAGVKNVLSTICWYSWRSAWGNYGPLPIRLLAVLRHAAKVFFPFIPSERKRMMDLADVLMPNSECEAKQLKRFFRIPREKIAVIPNAADPSFLKAGPELFIEKYGVRDFILCVGRIEPRKNQIGIIRALKNVQTPLVFIGDPVPDYQDYYNLCRREAGPGVIFLDHIPHGSDLLRSAYAACDTFLLPSWLETPGLAALEAGLAGAKIVITDQGATREYFQDLVSYVSPDNISQIRNSVLKVLNKKKDGALQNHILKQFLWSRTAEETFSVYQRLAQNVSEQRIPLRAKPCRIALAAPGLGINKSGLGVYVSNLVQYLMAEKNEAIDLRIFQDSKVSGHDYNTLHRWWWENHTLPSRVAQEGIAVLHVPAFAPPWKCSGRLVVTVHDLIGRKFPNQLRPFSAFYWGTWLPFAVRRADRIIADSQHTKKDLVEQLKIPEKKIAVIYPSGHESFEPGVSQDVIEKVKRNAGIHGPYFIFVGTLEPRKNLKRILEAFHIFLKNHRDYQLVLVGSKEFAHGKYIESLRKNYSLESESVRATGYLDHESLNALYCGARALLFPSLYEGFGMPILEAMASGCPVLTADITSTPEVAGDAGILVNPYRTDAIANGMNQLASGSELCKNLRLKGFEQIKKFSWKRTASETMKIYEELV